MDDPTRALAILATKFNAENRALFEFPIQMCFALRTSKEIKFKATTNYVPHKGMMLQIGEGIYRVVDAVYNTDTKRLGVIIEEVKEESVNLEFISNLTRPTAIPRVRW